MTPDALPKSVVCNVTERDYVLAMWANMRPRPWLRVVGCLLACLFLVVLVLEGLKLRSQGLDYHPFWVLLVAALYFLLVFLVWYPWRTRRHYRQQKASGAPFTLTADDSGMEFSGEFSTGRTPWDQLWKWKEAPCVFLLYYTDVLYLILPKRCFSMEQIDALRQTLMRHVRHVV